MLGNDTRYIYLLVPGISLKTQELYVIVFLARYLDLFSRYVSLYNTVMKLVFIGTSICIVWYMRFHKIVKQTYNKDEETSRHYFLIVPCLLLAMLVPRSFNFMEVRTPLVIYLHSTIFLTLSSFTVQTFVLYFKCRLPDETQ